MNNASDFEIFQWLYQFIVKEINNFLTQQAKALPQK